jgi:hypothetical protein
MTAFDCTHAQHNSDSQGAASAKGRFRRRHAALLAALFAAVSAHAQVTVSANGNPTYSQSIAVPPGVAGMSPKIELFYAGGGSNGPVGHGWSVGGISVITRCPPNKAVDGAPGTVDYNSGDHLCLDGQRLIQTDVVGAPLSFPQTNDAAGLSTGYREYRTEKDSYARVRAFGVAANSDVATGPAYFKVWTKAGQTYEYGASSAAHADALIQPSGKSVAIAWAVGRVSDTVGNFIDFKYDQHDVAWGSGPTAGTTPGHEWNISEIQYSGNKVVFSYADRGSTTPQDSGEAYHQGSKNVSVRLLQSITTYVNTLAVKSTKLTYDNLSVTGRSRLVRIEECAGTASSTRCLPPTLFAYSPGGNDFYQAVGSFTLTMQTQTGDHGVLLADFDGDGKSDFIRWSNTPSENQMYLSKGDGTFTQNTATFNITTENLFKSDGCYASMVGDFNGDGLPDILRYSAAKMLDGTTSCPSSPPSYLYINKGGGGFNDPVAIVGPSLERAISTTLSRCLVGWPDANGHCANNEDLLHWGWTRGANFYLMDVDGDGKMDIVTTILPYYGSNDLQDPCLSAVCTRVWLSNGDGTFSERTSNLSHTSIYVPPKASSGYGGPRNTVDFDGDGLVDLIGISTHFDKGTYFNTFAAFRSRGDGNFDSVAAAISCDTPLDFNGDGRTDCLVAGLNGDVANNGLIVADGSGTLQYAANFNLHGASDQLSGVDQNSLTNVGFVIADINGDGRSDVLRWKDDATQNALYLSNGDGTFSPSSSFNLNSSAFQLRKADGTVDFALGDFRGLGTTEILQMKSSGANQLFVKADTTPPDQLISVTDPRGATTTLYYVPLSNTTKNSHVSQSYGARYTSDRGTSNAAGGGKIDLTLPQYVVATSQTDSGVSGATLTTEYGYLGLKVNPNGRGILGFREVRRQSPGADGTNLTVFTQYLQDHPYIGIASRSETRKGTLNSATAQLLSSTVNVYCDKTANTGAENVATETAPCPTTASITRPYLRQSVESGFDLNGASLPQVTTVNVLNSSGDAMTITATVTGSVAGVGQTFTKVISNNYDLDNTVCSADDNCYWILGRLNRATVTNTVPDSRDQFPTSAGTGLYASAISGSGSTQTAVITPSLSFGTVVVSTPSTLTATVANNGASSLSVTVPTSASVSGTDFSFVSSTCASSLAAGANCAVVVKFLPTLSTARSGTLTVSTGAGVLTSSLSGTGASNTQTAAITPSTLAFGNVIVNQSSTLTATLANTGAVAVSVTVPASNSVSGTNFSFVSTTCLASLPVGSSCAVNVKFLPTAAASRTGKLTINTGAGKLSTNLSGTGVSNTQIATLTPSPLAFGNVLLNTTSTLTATLTNTGAVALTVTAPTASSVSGTYFSFSSTTCATSLAVGATCTVDVNFLPTGASSSSGTLSVVTGAGTKSVTLSGTGVNSTQAATLTPSSLAFGSVGVGTPASLTATLTNTGSMAISVSPASISGTYFSLAGNNCPASLAAAASCSLTVNFTPSTGGTQNGTLTVPTGPATFTTPLSGTGVTPSGSLTPSNLSFGNVNLGSSTTLNATLTNTGSAPLSFASASVSGATFSYASTTCPASLPVGTNCTIGVTFTPTSVTTTNGTLSVGTGAGTLTSTLVGSGTNSLSGTLTPTPSLDFQTITVGVAITKSAFLTNTGSQALTLNQPSASSVAGTDFSFVSTTCTSSLVVNGQCVINVQFLPSSSVARTGTLTLSTGAGTKSTGLTGTGGTPSTPIVSISPASQGYGNQLDGATVSNTFTATNSGTAGAFFMSLSGNSQFSIASTTCPANGTTVGAGSCTITVNFTGIAQCGGQVSTLFADLNVYVGSSTYGADASLNGQNHVYALTDPPCQ